MYYSFYSRLVRLEVGFQAVNNRGKHLFLFQIGSIRSMIHGKGLWSLRQRFYSRLVRLEGLPSIRLSTHTPVSIPDWFD